MIAKHSESVYKSNSHEDNQIPRRLTSETKLLRMPKVTFPAGRRGSRKGQRKRSNSRSLRGKRPERRASNKPKPKGRELVVHVNQTPRVPRNRISSVSARDAQVATVQRIAATFAAPYNFYPLRWKDAYTTRPTALTAPRTQHQIDFSKHYVDVAASAPFNMYQPTAAAQAEWPPNGTTFLAMSRSPHHNIIQLISNPEGLPCSREALFNKSDYNPALGNFYQFRAQNLGDANEVIVEIPVAALNVTSSYVPGNERISFGARANEKHAFWVDGYTAVMDTATGAAEDTAIMVNTIAVSITTGFPVTWPTGLKVIYMLHIFMRQLDNGRQLGDPRNITHVWSLETRILCHHRHRQEPIRR
jgi:hypothetical protein